MNQTESELHSRLEERDAEIEGLKDEIKSAKSKALNQAADDFQRVVDGCRALPEDDCRYCEVSRINIRALRLRAQDYEARP